MTNTERTLKLLKKNGYIAAIVERWLRYAGNYGLRKDMFGFADIVAINGKNIIAVQSCGTGFSQHHLKLTDVDNGIPDNIHLWLKSGGMFFLIGWRKVKVKRGGKREVYSPRIRMYYIPDDGDGILFEYKDLFVDEFISKIKRINIPDNSKCEGGIDIERKLK